MHDWKHGKKGSGVFWLQQARDEVRLSKIARQLFDFVGKPLSDESFKVNFNYMHHDCLSFVWLLFLKETVLELRLQFMCE